MNNPSPLVPQGSLQQNAKSRSYVKMAFFTVVAIHIVFFGGLLFQGCKKKTADTDNFAASQTNVDSSSLNVTPPMTGTDSNLVNPTSLGNAPAGGIGLAGSNQYVAPVVPVVEPPPAAPATRDYIVIKGDIVATIAKKNGVTQKALLDANPGLVPTKLKIGQKIQLPASAGAAPMPVGGIDPAAAPVAAETSSYVVKTGDTLTKIAKAHGTTAKAVRSLNGLKTDQIQVGKKLKLPAAKAAPAPAAPEPQPMPGATTVPTTSAAPATLVPPIAQPIQPIRTAPVVK